MPDGDDDLDEEIEEVEEGAEELLVPDEPSDSPASEADAPPPG